MKKMPFNCCQLHSSLHFKGKKKDLNMQCDTFNNYNSQISIKLLIN